MLVVRRKAGERIVTSEDQVREASKFIKALYKEIKLWYYGLSKRQRLYVREKYNLKLPLRRVHSERRSRYRNKVRV